MAEEYRFLRFEVSGIATILYAIVLALPFVGDKLTRDFFAHSSFFLAFVGGAFILSLPFGYAIHQIVVNRYRSGKKEGGRPGVKLAERIIRRNERFRKIWDNELDLDNKIAFVTVVMEVALARTKELNTKELNNRRETRWSHYYARRAVGIFSPILGAILFVVFAIACILIGDYFVFSCPRLLVFLVILAIIICFSILVIIRYSRKLWYEICNLELVSVELSESEIEDVIELLIDYLESIGGLPNGVRSNPDLRLTGASGFGGN